MSRTAYGEPQFAPAVLMVRPAAFGFNPEAAATNTFQTKDNADPAAVHSAALREFDAFAERLDAAGIVVVIAPDTPLPVKPDAVFPNNWLSFHADGTAMLYPMLAPNRRLERSDAVLAAVNARYPITRVLDLSPLESRGAFVEGTGSLVLDRPNRVAYASDSPRTTPDGVRAFCAAACYTAVPFRSTMGGKPIYHTNVVLSLGDGFAILCPDVIDPLEPVEDSLAESGREVVHITPAQLSEFAGNALHLAGAQGPLTVLSERAYRSLEPAQIRSLERYGSLLPVAIPIIERYGGGSARCMLAEIHQPACGL